MLSGEGMRKPAHLAAAFYQQLEAEGVDEDTARQAVKCLVYLALPILQQDKRDGAFDKVGAASCCQWTQLCWRDQKESRPFHDVLEGTATIVCWQLPHLVGSYRNFQFGMVRGALFEYAFK
jgi:hypothetical protein